jgi:hypothetical protein
VDWLVNAERAVGMVDYVRSDALVEWVLLLSNLGLAQPQGLFTCYPGPSPKHPLYLPAKTMSVLSTGLTELGSSKDAPAPENSLLDEEMHLMNPETSKWYNKNVAVAFDQHPKGFCRILNCFEFRSNGILINLNLAQLRETDFQGLEVIGAMAVMWGKSGMFAQAC